MGKSFLFANKKECHHQWTHIKCPLAVAKLCNEINWIISYCKLLTKARWILKEKQIRD